MRERLIELLSDVRDDVDFENETALIDDDILESFDILQIISAISEEFEVDIPALQIVPDNFNSVDAMLELISRLEDE